MSTRVLLLYGQQLLSDGLTILLRMHKEIQLVGSSPTLSDADPLCAALEPDVMVVGVDMQRCEDAAWVSHCLSMAKTPIVLLADRLRPMFGENFPGVLNCSWVSPRSSMDELLLAIRTAATGRHYQCALSRQALACNAPAGLTTFMAGQARLAERESQVLRLIAQGYSSKGIARELHIAPSTVEVHRRNIMRKVNLHKVADLTRYAIQHRLVSHDVGDCATSDKR